MTTEEFKENLHNQLGTQSINPVSVGLPHLYYRIIGIDAAATLFAAEIEKKDAEIAELKKAFKRLNDDLIKAEAYGFNRFLDFEDLKHVIVKKDKEIKDLRFTAYKRLQDIQLLEQRIAELNARIEIATSFSAFEKEAAALRQRIAELEGQTDAERMKRILRDKEAAKAYSEKGYTSKPTAK